MASRLERALAELVGGYEGGWAMFMIGLMKLDLAAADLRQLEHGFRSHPEGAWNRLLSLVDEALRTCELAVDLENALADRQDEPDDEQRRQDVAELLLGRARALADERLHAPPEELSGLRWRRLEVS
jgi:hypothetical protein